MLIKYCQNQIKDRFWPRVSKRIARHELTVDELVYSLSAMAQDDGINIDDAESVEFKRFIMGKLGFM